MVSRMSLIDRLRILYIVGAVVDAVAAVALLSPAGSPIRALAYPGVDATQIAFADGTRAAFGLMVGWTVLLAWGARRPVERRMVLLLTAFPVVTGLMVTELIEVASGRASVPGTLGTLVLQAALCAIFLAGFIAARRVAVRTDDSDGTPVTSE